MNDLHASADLRLNDPPMTLSNAAERGYPFLFFVTYGPSNPVEATDMFFDLVEEFEGVFIGQGEHDWINDQTLLAFGFKDEETARRATSMIALKTGLRVSKVDLEKALRRID